MSQIDFKLMITCEHASNELPSHSPNRGVSQELLESHRGYDIGAFAVYEELVKKFRPDFYSAGKYSRLYIDLNRSLRNCRNATPQAIAYHQKYWEAAEQFVAKQLANESGIESGLQIIHLAIHSFTPELNGEIRNADIGILYDPSRTSERACADIIVDEIHHCNRKMIVRRNYPYQGKTDGLCTALRKKFDPFKTGRYIGFEIEINQKLLQSLG